MRATSRDVEWDVLAAEVHRDHARWWRDPATGEPIYRDPDLLWMLVVSELSEGMEGARKDLMDDHLPKRKMLEVEVADALIRILDLTGKYGFKIDLGGRAPRVLSDNPGAALMAIVKHVTAVSNMMTLKADKPHIERGVSSLIKCLLDYCDKFGLDLWGAVQEKRAYNLVRADHKDENRMKKGGKKW
jgi:hypothetical protein